MTSSNAGLIDRICHKEQIGIWADEIISALALSDFLREEWSFDDTVDLGREIQAQLRDIIGSALTHPEFNIVEALSASQARVKVLEEALESARTHHEEQDKALSKQPPSSGPNGNQWARMLHREQIDAISATLKSEGEI